MKTLSYIGFLFGLAGITGLVAWQGIGPVAAALGELGAGVLLLPLVYLLYLIVLVVSWRMLFIAGREPGFLAMLNAAWIGGAVTTVVPVTTLGGEVIKARVLTHSGVRGADASASVVVDTTVQAVSVVALGFIGVALLMSLNADDALVIGVRRRLRVARRGRRGLRRAAARRRARLARQIGRRPVRLAVDERRRQQYGRGRRDHPRHLSPARPDRIVIAHPDQLAHRAGR